MSPIDARIPLMAQMPHVNSPLEAVGIMTQLQAMQVARQQSERRMRAEMRKQQLAQQYPNDRDAFLQAFGREFPEEAIVIGEKLASMRKEQMAAYKGKLETDEKHLEIAGRIFDGVGDDGSYQAARTWVLKMDPRYQSMLPEQFDPTTVQRIRSMALSAKDFAEGQRKGIEFAMEGKWREGLGAALSVAPNQEAWSAVLTQAKQAGAPAADLALFSPQWSPEAQAAAGQAAISPEKRADLGLKAQTEERHIARDVALQQHQQTMEGISRGHLAVSQANLAERRKEAANPQQKPLTATAESNIINRLSSQWTASSKSSKELDRAVSLMETGLTAARRGDLAQGSQAILVTFQKILDPTSVVRESEYARSAAGQSLLNRIQGAAEQLAQGGAGVRLGELEKFANLAREMAHAQKSTLGSTRERIGKTADRYNIPRELVLEEGGVSSVESATLASGGGGPKEGDTKPIPGYPGTQQTYRSGKWIRTK